MTQPTKWSMPLGSGADVQELPDDDLKYASFSKIFPQITQVPLSAGGVAPRRIDFNSLFKLLADNIYYYQNGGVFEYSDTTDYEKGALVRYNDKIYLCIQENSSLNKHAPNDTEYWLRVALNNDLANYLPLAGGNLTGNLTVQNKNVVRTINDVEADVNGNVVIESGTSYEIGQIIKSLIPLSNAMLHPTDGAIISGSGSYAEFVTFMAGKVSTNPNLFVSEAVWQQSVANYGECGKFVYDDVANTIRLPLLNGFVQATNTASEVGDLVEAGLPNIEGYIGTINHLANSASGAFQEKAGHDNKTILDTVNTNTGVVFDASLSNPIYGNSNTVQPQAIKVYSYIVLGTVTKTDIQIDIDNVMSDLALKADKDLNNVTSPTQVFKDMSIRWGQPDYTSAIAITLTLNTSVSYIAPSDGYIIYTLTALDLVAYVNVNSHNVAYFQSASGNIANASSGIIPVHTGDTIQIQCTGSDTVYYDRKYNYAEFVPCKGV